MNKYLRLARLRIAHFLFNMRLDAFDHKVFEAGYNRAGRTLYHVTIYEVKVGDHALQRELDAIYAKYDEALEK